MPNVEYLANWRQRNKAPRSLGAAAPDDPLTLLEHDLDRRIRNLESNAALKALEVPERRRPSAENIRDMHDQVRAAIDDAFHEFHYQTNTAWCVFKDAIAPVFPWSR